MGVSPSFSLALQHVRCSVTSWMEPANSTHPYNAAAHSQIDPAAVQIPPVQRPHESLTRCQGSGM